MNRIIRFIVYVLYCIFKLIKKLITYSIYYLKKSKPSNNNKYLIYILFITISAFLLDLFYTVNFKNLEINIRLLNYVMDGYIRFITLSIPVVLAFSYFIYREQQSISLRHKVFDLLFTYFVISIPGLILALYIKLKMITIVNQVEYFIFINDFYKMTVIAILIILKVIFLPYFIGTLLKILSITNQIKLSIKNIFLYLKLLYNIRTSKKKSTYFFENAHDYLESIFQSFEYALDNKIDKIFTNEFNRLSEIFLKIMDEPPFRETIIFSQLLTQNHPNEFRKLYQSMVNNIGNLIFNLYQNKKEIEMPKAFQILRDIEPNKVPELYPLYFQELESIAVRSLNNNDIIFERVLSLLERISESNITEKDICNDRKPGTSTNAVGVLLIYQSMLKVAVEKNDVKHVTSITYSMNRFVSSKANNLEVLDKKFENHFVEAIQLSILDSLNRITVQRLNFSLLSEITLFILFQGTLKSIEIGSYGATGQLIKRITTDFKGEKINLVYKAFNDSRGELKKSYPEFDDNHLLNDLITIFRFNERSYNYCNQKLLFLLLGQELFIVKENITFTKFYKFPLEISDIIPTSYFNLEYLNYICKKITSVGNKYGLAYIKEKEFILNLVKLINQQSTENHLTVSNGL